MVFTRSWTDGDISSPEARVVGMISDLEKGKLRGWLVWTTRVTRGNNNQSTSIIQDTLLPSTKPVQIVGGWLHKLADEDCEPLFVASAVTRLCFPRKPL